MDVTKVIRVLALLSNVLLQLSPIRMVREIQQAGSTLQYDALPLVTMFFSSVQWFLYAFLGLTLEGDSAMVSVMEAFVLGVVFGALYLVVFGTALPRRLGCGTTFEPGLCRCMRHRLRGPLRPALAS
eukprot:SRR837773.15957.p1 GENE.SRR837773.15957~~SRR837773.15957.p1  ORF type:complete len:140 (+),score=34.89 SRR837773.15957:40-420(+)